jgi:hypothetical protein
LANKNRGEVSFEANEKSYTMRFSANALCELEDVLNMGVNDVAEQMSKPKNLRIKTVRGIFWAGLRDYHPEITIQQAGELIQDITLPRCLELIGKAFNLAFQDSTKVRPQQPGPTVPAKIEAAGTGLLS